MVIIILLEKTNANCGLWITCRKCAILNAMKLYDHQIKIIKENKTKCGLWLGTGSAKTATSLHMSEGNTLVICPKTIRDAKTWEREKDKWNLSVRLKVLSKEDFKKADLNMPRVDTLIIDEAHVCAGVTPSIRYRNKQPIPKASQIYESLLSFIRRVNPKRLYLLTATPTRSPMVVYGLATLLGRQWDFYKFRDMFYVKLPIGRDVWTPRKDKLSKERLGKIVRSLGYVGQLSDFFDVPEQTFKTVYLNTTKEQEKRLKEIKLEYPDPIVLLGKRHQIENGVLTDDDEYIKDEKIDAIIDLAFEFPKMVIFAKYTKQIEKIKKCLIEEKYNVLTLQGDTKNRDEIITQANNSKECILIVQSSISAGWEISDIPVMVFASMSYSIVDYTQSQGRILRANKLKKNLYIHLIVKDGIDEAVYKSIMNKQDFIEAMYIKQNEKA